MNKIIPLSLLTGLVVFCFLYIKQCNQNSNQANAMARLETKIKTDSIKSLDNKKRFDSTLHSAKTNIDSISTAKQHTEDSLDLANARIDKLLARYKPIKVDNDTGNTYVPNEFINECSDCFTELPLYKNLANKYRKQVHDEDSAHKQQDTVYENRITELSQEKKNVQDNLDSCMKLKTPTPILEQRAMLLANISVLSISNLVPAAAGVGFTYQDKRGRHYGGRIMGSAQGTMYFLDVGAPFIFFKNRK